MKNNITYFIKFILVLVAIGILLFHIQDTLSLVIVPIILIYLIRFVYIETSQKSKR